MLNGNTHTATSTQPATSTVYVMGILPAACCHRCSQEQYLVACCAIECQFHAAPSLKPTLLTLKVHQRTHRSTAAPPPQCRKQQARACVVLIPQACDSSMQKRYHSTHIMIQLSPVMQTPCMTQSFLTLLIMHERLLRNDAGSPTQLHIEP